ncbi:phage tail terminator-like protein [Franconibacter helveticus]|uniref:phage tail terminator-like protein n=1 Tax=Franconibacter helveticus TaxID=357240 RepID=UPI000DA11A27|nr:phage tail terminator-like protein [Franconibacter helveticus]
MIPDITTALEARLGAWAEGEGVPVAWDNIQFEPPTDALYLISHDMPARPYSIDLAGECRVYPGVYQVSVVAPAGGGKAQARALARRVAALFPENEEIPGDGFSAWVTSPPAIYPGVPDGVSFTIPVSINYRADISA